MLIFTAERLKPMLRPPQSDAQTLGKNAICLVSPSGEVTVVQPDKSVPTKKREAIAFR